MICGHPSPSACVCFYLTDHSRYTGHSGRLWGPGFRRQNQKTEAITSPQP